MGEHSSIEWTTHTFNPWIGCAKVSPACDFCYAERENNRRKWNGGVWGPGSERRVTSDANWRKPHQWNRAAPRFREEHGYWPRVFCASLADVFDNEVNPMYRDGLWEVIEATPDLRWQLLTKRGPNVAKMVPDGFFARNQHVGLMFSISNQDEADRDVPRLLDLKAGLGIRWVGLSCEPLLGPISLTRIATKGGWYDSLGGWRNVRESPSHEGVLDWVIVGGESGPNARPTHPAWARDLRDQCDYAGTPFLFKQWGEWSPYIGLPSDRKAIVGEGFDRYQLCRVGKKAAGRLLDGREWNGFPEALTA